MHTDLDALVIALYVRIDDFLPRWCGRGRPPLISDAELICLAVAQMFLSVPNDRKFLGVARWRLGHLFPYLPQQPGYNKRIRALAPTIGRVIGHLAAGSPSFFNGLRLLDSTPVPCGQSRETSRRSELAGSCAYGWCQSHSRYFWGYRLYLLCAADGMPIAFELAAANTPERQVAAEMLERLDLTGYTVMADKGFAGEEFEQLMAATGARFLRSRPQKRTTPPREPRPGAPMDRVSVLDVQRPTRPRTPRRTDRHRRLHARRAQTPGNGRRPRPQPTDRQPRTPLRRLRLLIRNQPSS